MVRPKGLGRGLDVLLPLNTVSSSTDLISELPPHSLRPGRFQPRTRMDDASISELAESIRVQGVIQPIVVRAVGEGSYEIIAGERRWRAAQAVGLENVPVIVRQVPDDAALAMALIENIQREDLNPLDEANGIQRLIQEFGMTHETAAQAVGRSRSAVTNLLRLLNLTAIVQDLLLDGRIEMGHARALLPLSPSKQAALAQRVVEDNLSVRDIEQMVVSEMMPARPQPHTNGKRSRDQLALEESLSDVLGSTVRIFSGKRGNGKLVISFASLDQLDPILKKLLT
jgi:ParB family transcriptional regulator, chromosome partitioning protein